MGEHSHELLGLAALAYFAALMAYLWLLVRTDAVAARAGAIALSVGLVLHGGAVLLELLHYGLSPATNMKEFVALARANPDKFNCATPPIGTSTQIQLEVLKIREKLPKLADVVFKGGGDAITALLGGSVQLSSGSLGPAAPHIKAGKLRCLAVSAESRWPDLPDVPTMLEQGYKDFVFPTDMVLLAPAKTPPDIVAWVEKETLKVLSTPEMKEKLYKSGFTVRPKGAKDAWARVTKEIGQFKEIIDTAGIPKIE